MDQGFYFPTSFNSVNQAIEVLEQSLTLGKILIARSQTHQMSSIYFTLLDYLQLSLKLDEKNSGLFNFLSKEDLKDYAA